jgi:acetyl-CoA carboxylase biotin carboxyl carrier protein
MPQKSSPPKSRLMDVKDIKALVQLMVENDLGEIEITDGPARVHLKKQGPAPVMLTSAGAVAAAPAAAPPSPREPAGAPARPADDLIEIRSPMVGTFYAAPSPDSESYVTEGAAVRDDTIVCIVEAMKVMNEIKAECSGVIREVCVKNAQPVEFGQLLFRVKPS